MIAEIVSGLAIIVTLVILIQEVKNNTNTIQLQIAEQGSAAANMPFINPESLPDIYAKIKEIDSDQLDEIVKLYVDKYGMSVQEAIQWSRFVGMSWRVEENNFVINGPSDELALRINAILTRRDQKLYYDTNSFLGVASGFRRYIETSRMEGEELAEYAAKFYQKRMSIDENK